MTFSRRRGHELPGELPGGCVPLAPYGLVGIPLDLAWVLVVRREVIGPSRILALQHQPAQAGYAG